ncbi:hypothetical protein M5K25_001761 [Dendrobium thyrsiflorum]|uniref:Uncharacterized protein n=1 Tax=Dendrobium thyrsiflorum TaxID=117978 RepID=A0ABD0W2C3_DENTH
MRVPPAQDAEGKTYVDSALPRLSPPLKLKEHGQVAMKLSFKFLMRYKLLGMITLQVFESSFSFHTNYFEIEILISNLESKEEGISLRGRIPLHLDIQIRIFFLSVQRGKTTPFLRGSFFPFGHPKPTNQKSNRRIKSED